MPQKLMDVLMLGRCSHEFSWPRRAADGNYYQVCLLCAAEYKYDWNAMKRIKRVVAVLLEAGGPSTKKRQLEGKREEADMGSARSPPGVARPCSLPSKGFRDVA